MLKLYLKIVISFSICVIHINDQHINTTKYLLFIIPVRNLIDDSDHYSNVSGHLW